MYHYSFNKNNLFLLFLSFFLNFLPINVFSQTNSDLLLGPGDDIRVKVFQNPELSYEGRIPESGFISYPLIGSIQIGGLSVNAAETKISNALKFGKFLLQPQVNIVLVQSRGNQVSVLGQVAKPGRFPLETFNVRVTDVLAMAGGSTLAGDDTAILTGIRNQEPIRKVIDIPAIFLDGQNADNVLIVGGDTLFVPKAPMYYIYGEAQKPGAYRVERNMTVRKALATGGGPTARGSNTRLRLSRRNSDGTMQETTPKPDDIVFPEDVIYVKESLF
jgi:polysaccharide export outer membrane protein